MNTKTVLTYGAVIITFALIAAPLAFAASASAFSFSSQSITQKQSGTQSSLTIGFANLFLGNNLLGQFQSNLGGNVVVQ
ncbi:MAG TPA: hypothetical protein VD815_08285 [Candidatus Saccharimonadales bacterium]|nr:hypothetical protein [Candidatus Saccharimonadales bacterium]